MTPKLYLIGRMTDDQRHRAQQMLAMTPLAGVVVADQRDIALAHEYSRLVESLKQPIGIIADFNWPLTAINEDGSLCPLL